MDQETKDYIDKTKEEIFDKLGNRYQSVLTAIQLELLETQNRLKELEDIACPK